MKRGDAALYEEGPGPLPGYAPLPSAAAPAPWQGGGGGAGGGGMYAAAATVPGPQPGVSYLYEGGAAPGAPLLAPAYGGGSAGGAFPGAGAHGAGAGADDVFGYDVAFASRAMRHAFVRKVLGVVCCQLLLTAAVAAGVLLAPGGGRWVARNAGWALPAAAGATFGTLLLMLCSERARRAYPGNLFLLGVFTAAQGLLVGVAVAAYSAPSVVLAVVMSAAVCLALVRGCGGGARGCGWGRGGRGCLGVEFCPRLGSLRPRQPAAVSPRPPAACNTRDPTGGGGAGDQQENTRNHPDHYTTNARIHQNIHTHNKLPNISHTNNQIHNYNNTRHQQQQPHYKNRPPTRSRHAMTLRLPAASSTQRSGCCCWRCWATWCSGCRRWM